MDQKREESKKSTALSKVNQQNKSLQASPTIVEKPVFLPSLEQKEEGLLLLYEQQQVLAKKLFSFAPMEELPEWAKPLEVEEPKKQFTEKLQALEKKTQECVDQSLQEKRVAFQSKYQEMELKEKAMRNSIAQQPCTHFSEEKKVILEHGQQIQERKHRIEEMMKNVNKFFSQDKEN